MQDTLNLVLNNLEKSIYENLEQSLKLEKESKINKDRKRIDFLKEQSSIARELNIKNNTLNFNTMVSNYNQTENFNTMVSSYYQTENFNTMVSNYYQTGYLAIDKEIDLIKKREYKNFKFLEQEINSLKKKKIQWVNYNIYLINTKSLKNTKSILIKSVLLGFILSILYVFISNIFKSHTHVRKN